MSWELQIWRRCASSGTSNGEDSILGKVDRVKSEIESFFPEVVWEKRQGFCDWKDGSIEFALHDNPVTWVGLRVHDTDPSIQLIAMVRAYNWIITNDSSGAELESEIQVNYSEIAQIQAEANSNSRRKLEPKPKLPRIKSRIPLTEVKPESVIIHLEMLTLRDDEVTTDVFDEISEALQQDKRISSLKGQPGFQTAEVVLPDGQRLSAIVLSRTVLEVAEFFDNYWKEKSRSVAKYVDGRIVLEDGTEFNAKDCLWVERAYGNARK